MASKSLQSLWPVDLSLHLIFRLPEILHHILTYAITIQSLKRLPLVCKAWRNSIINIMGPELYGTKSVMRSVRALTTMTLNLIANNNDMAIPLIYQFMRSCSNKSPNYIFRHAVQRDNRTVTSYMKSHYICHINDLVGWTVMGYVKDCYVSQFTSLNGYTVPNGCASKMKFGMTICKPGSIDPLCRRTLTEFAARESDNSLGKSDVAGPRTLLILSDIVRPLTYRILECYNHPIIEPNNWPYITLNNGEGEVIESVKCDSDLYDSTIPQLSYYAKDNNGIEIYTKSKKFSFDVENPYSLPSMIITDR